MKWLIRKKILYLFFFFFKLYYCKINHCCFTEAIPRTPALRKDKLTVKVVSPQLRHRAPGCARLLLPTASTQAPDVCTSPWRKPQLRTGTSLETWPGDTLIPAITCETSFKEATNARSQSIRVCRALHLSLSISVSCLTWLWKHSRCGDDV